MKTAYRTRGFRVSGYSVISLESILTLTAFRGSVKKVDDIWYMYTSFVCPNWLPYRSISNVALGSPARERVPRTRKKDVIRPMAPGALCSGGVQTLPIGNLGKLGEKWMDGGYVALGWKETGVEEGGAWNGRDGNGLGNSREH